MPESSQSILLDALLDSWDRSNAILVNLLRAIPEEAMGLRPMKSSPSVGQLFAHIHYVRLVFISEDAPEFVPEVPQREWDEARDRDRMVAMLDQSAQAVREAVLGRLQAGRPMDLHYDHPVLFIQHMLWHEGYHQGQIKLTLKLAGQPIPNEIAGPISWRIWMNKQQT